VSRNNVTVTVKPEEPAELELPELSDAAREQLCLMDGKWKKADKNLPRTIKSANSLARTSEKSFQEMVKAMESGCIIVALKFCYNGWRTAIMSAKLYEELKERPDISKLLHGAAKYAETTYERFKRIETLKDKSMIPDRCMEWHRIFKKVTTETVK